MRAKTGGREPKMSSDKPVRGGDWSAHSPGEYEVGTQWYVELAR